MAVWTLTSVSDIEDDVRIDAEYYHPENKLLARELDLFHTVPLGSFAFITDGQHGYFKLDPNSEIRQITAKHIEEGLINKNDADRLSEETHSKNTRSSLCENDLLITTAGTIGRIGFVTKDIPPANIDQDLARVAIRNGSIKPLFLWVYLQTRFGQFQINRFTTGQVQQHLSLAKSRKLRVPEVDWQDDIVQLAELSINKRFFAKNAYQQAQSLLESELGLDKLSFDKPVSYAARFSEVALSQAILANRIDAQCFSPTALQYEQALSKLPNVQPLRFLTAAMVKGTQQEESPEGTIPYVSIKHIQNNEIVAEGKSRRFKGMPVAKQGDLLLAITGATIGKVGIVSRYEELTFSGDMLAITANGSIDPHYLLAFLSHRIGQVQLQRWITGSTNGHLSPHDVGRILIPRLDEKLEQRIASLIKESIDKTHESERLLEQAKHRVEALIEEAIAA